MLDYAQIKAGKFRESISNFDIKKTVRMVMNIQRVQAEDKNIYLRDEYYGFDNDYMVRTDE